MKKVEENENKDIFSLCKWNEISSDNLNRFQVGSYFETAGFDEQGLDLFGRSPKIFLHKGDVSLGKDFSMYAQGNGIFVIDGSLTVEGTLGFYAADAYTFLIVMGDVRAENFVQGWDTQLGVSGSLLIKKTAWIDLSDAGFTVVKGSIKAKSFLKGSRSATYCGSEPESISKDQASLYSEEFMARFTAHEQKHGPDIETVIDGLTAGVTLFSE